MAGKSEVRSAFATNSPPPPPTVCPECGGSGSSIVTDIDGTNYVPCPSCTGKAPDQPDQTFDPINGPFSKAPTCTCKSAFPGFDRDPSCPVHSGGSRDIRDGIVWQSPDVPGEWVPAAERDRLVAELERVKEAVRVHRNAGIIGEYHKSDRTLYRSVLGEE